MPRSKTPHLLFMTIATVPLAHAQEFMPTPASPEACVAISSDAARLSCYDQALSRRAPGTPASDTVTQPPDNLSKQPIDATLPNSTGVAKRTHPDKNPLFKQDRYDSTIAKAGNGSLLDSRWELAQDSKLGTFQLRGYKPVYLLPAFWSSHKNTQPFSPNPLNTVTKAEQSDSLELKFQISFKAKILENIFGDNGDLWGTYTQSSHLQSYNGAQSRPFRETNYEPELILALRNDYNLFGWKGRMSAIQLTHQSNGQSDPLSRSWNRLILNIGLDRDHWALILRPWYRLPETRKQDDNPDIENYMGRGDATLIYSHDGQELALMARHSLRGGARSHGAVQLDWGFPISSLLRGHVQVVDGYGESMIDYNHRATYLGLGISLLEWF